VSTRPAREETERDMWHLSERDKAEGKQGVAQAREALAQGTRKRASERPHDESDDRSLRRRA
jgi:hypothetical protein